MTVTHQIQLPVDAETAFRQVKRPALLHYVADPLVRFEQVMPFPDIWQPGQYETRMCFLGWLPLGRQTIGIDYPATRPGTYQLHDQGRGNLVAVWDHLITIEAVDPNHCRYTDRVRVRAGLFTPVVWGFAWVFYAWRQRRWQQLVWESFGPLVIKTTNEV